MHVVISIICDKQYFSLPVFPGLTWGTVLNDLVHHIFCFLCIDDRKSPYSNVQAMIPFDSFIPKTLTQLKKSKIVIRAVSSKWIQAASGTIGRHQVRSSSK